MPVWFKGQLNKVVWMIFTPCISIPAATVQFLYVSGENLFFQWSNLTLNYEGGFSDLSFLAAKEVT